MNAIEQHILRWTEIYISNNIAVRWPDITLPIFLTMPETILQDLLFRQLPAGEDYCPLLDKQEVVKQRLDAQLCGAADMESIESFLMAEDACRLSDGRYIEPLHHHRYSTSRDRKNLS